MELSSKKTNFLKSAVAVAAVAIAAVNFSQANNKVSVASLATITDAKADPMVCPDLLNSICYGYTDDGVYHESTNSENKQ
jgi:hypothetical protein